MTRSPSVRPFALVRRGPAAGPLAVLVGATAATASVSRYDLRIVVVYTVLAALLAGHLWTATRPRSGAAGGKGTRAQPLSGRAACLVLLACAAATWFTPTFSYLEPAAAARVRLVLSGAAVLAGLALLGRHRGAADLAFGVAVLGHVSAAVLLIRGDRAPRIDVWVMLQQAADATLHGGNIYTQTWTGSPGVQDAFTYLPWMGLLVAPGRWLAGDVRWALLVITVSAAALPWWVSRRGLHDTAHAVADAEAFAARHRFTTTLACLVILLPGTSTQVEQAWTEPVLLACLTGWYLAARRERGPLAVLALAVGLACKQHVWPLLAIMAAWRRFGVRRTLVAVAVAAALMSPWFVADPAAMGADTVTLLVRFRALLFADTLYIAAIHELGLTPPFWLTGVVLATALLLAAGVVWRRRPDPGVVLRIIAAVLLVANLVNKQAFYNQYWLVMTLVLVSWMPLPDGISPPRRRPGAGADARPDRPTATAEPPTPDPAARTAP